MRRDDDRNGSGGGNERVSGRRHPAYRTARHIASNDDGDFDGGVGQSALGPFQDEPALPQVPPGGSFGGFSEGVDDGGRRRDDDDSFSDNYGHDPGSPSPTEAGTMGSRLWEASFPAPGGRDGSGTYDDR